MPIKLSEDKKTLDIYVYGTIKANTGWWTDSSTEFSTSQAVRNINDFEGDNINLYINSPGGEVFGTLNMIQALSQHKATVTSYSNGGIIASAATLLHNSADKRVMYDTSLYMIHLPLSGAKGNRIEISKTLELLDAVEQMMLNMYLDKTNLQKEELVTMLEKETWLSASKALSYGFVDEVIKNTKKKPKAEIDNVNNTFSVEGFNFSFENCYDIDETKKLLLNCVEEAGADIQPYNEGGTEMDFEKLMDSLTEEQRALIESGISEQVQARVAALGTTDSPVTSEAHVDAIEETLSSTDPSLVEGYRQLKEMQSQMEEQLKNMKKEAAYNEFVNALSSYGNLPLTEAHKKALFNIKETCSDEYASLESLFKVANTAITAQMTPEGESGVGAENTGSDFLAAVEAESKLNPEMSYAAVVSKVAAERPDLYDHYRDQFSN